MCTNSQKTYQTDYSLQRLKNPFLDYCLISYIRIRTIQEKYWCHKDIMDIQSFENENLSKL
jgi:hypothetical protein